jgi:Tfp pilus assembly protein FimT
MKTGITTILRRLGKNTNKGVSIFESMMAISMATILSAIVTPGFIGYVGKERLAKAANEIVLDILKTKMNAIRENRNYQISFTGVHEYKIYRDDNSNSVFEQNELVETGNLAARYHGVSLSSTASLTLSPRGTASAATITITNGRWQKNLTVNIAGRTTISS